MFDLVQRIREAVRALGADAFISFEPRGVARLCEELRKVLASRQPLACPSGWLRSPTGPGASAKSGVMA